MAKRKPPTPLVVDVKKCARCGGNHRKVRFRKFGASPPGVTHWAPCPNTREPILAEVTHG